MDAQTYDHGWDARWDDMKQYGPYSRHVRRWNHLLLDKLNFMSVLDVGCGQGHNLRDIMGRYPHVVRVGGIELSPGALKVAQQRIPTGHFEAMDLQIQHLAETYDLIICNDVVEHIPDDTAALHNIRLMTGKYALISSIQGNFLPEWEAKAVGHVRNYRRGELADKMIQAGFVIERVVEWGFPFYSPIYRRLLTGVGGQGTDGEYGRSRKLLAEALYRLFLMNSATRGDLVFILARI